MSEYHPRTHPTSRAPHHAIGRTLGISALVVLVVGSILAAVIAFFAVSWDMEFGSQHTVDFTVASLDDQATSNSDGSSGHQYLIFTKSGQEYVDTDAWFHGKTDSSNVWNQFLQAGIGAEWQCPVYGWRITLTSSYPDVLDGCKLLKQGKTVYQVG